MDAVQSGTRSDLTPRTLVFIGAAILAVGVFTPLLRSGMVGDVNLFNMSLFGIAVIIATGVAVFLALNDRIGDVFWPGIAAAGITLFAFGRTKFMIASMRESVEKDLANNPFKGMVEMASNVQMQWGWLVLAAGAGTLIYAAVNARRAAEAPYSRSNTLMLASLAVLAVPIAYDLYGYISRPALQKASAPSSVSSLTDSAVSSADEVNAKPSIEEAAYIKQNLTLYDLEAKYFETYSGRTPGVNFKMKNNGNRTLNSVTVRIVFKDAEGNAIAEEEYNPVLVSSYGTDNTPLRPGYIYQNERDKFYTADKVPSEWKSGNASATITDIEFAPE